ncbi:MAG: hypothetical protein AAF289_14245 [Cyanobacteria bacterium P01_A01_bin.135]
MSEEIIYTRPLPSFSDDAEDACLQAAWATHQFYREVEQRQDFEAYCQRYYRLAESHRRESERLSQDADILGWFC